jgi:hypothetical protein
MKREGLLLSRVLLDVARSTSRVTVCQDNTNSNSSIADEQTQNKPRYPHIASAIPAAT